LVGVSTYDSPQDCAASFVGRTAGDDLSEDPEIVFIAREMIDKQAARPA
jgi:hypothetical protein